MVNKFILKEKREWTLAALTLVTCAAFSYHTFLITIRDYRPYAIGENITNNMTLPEGAKLTCMKIFGNMKLMVLLMSTLQLINHGN